VLLSSSVGTADMKKLVLTLGVTSEPDRGKAIATLIREALAGRAAQSAHLILIL
jgi:hypothetical protein